MNYNNYDVIVCIVLSVSFTNDSIVVNESTPQVSISLNVVSGELDAVLSLTVAPLFEGTEGKSLLCQVQCILDT